MHSDNVCSFKSAEYSAGHIIIPFSDFKHDPIEIYSNAIQVDLRPLKNTRKASDRLTRILPSLEDRWKIHSNFCQETDFSKNLNDRWNWKKLQPLLQ